MKKILIITMVLLSTVSFAEVDSTVTTYNVGIEGGSEVTDMLRDMASELNTTTEYLWEVTVKQGVVNAWKNLIYTIVILSVFSLIFFLIRAKYKTIRYKEHNNDETMWKEWDDWMAATYIIGGIMGVGTIITLCVCTGAIINGFVNPEYWALDTILDKLTPSK